MASESFIESVQGFLHRYKLTDRKLLPLKVALFTFNGAMACILPYLTVHMKQIGINIQETAVVYAVLPLSTFAGPPVLGFMADKLGRYKPVLIMSLMMTTLLHTAMLLVPAAVKERHKPRVELTCGPKSVHVLAEGCPGQHDPCSMTSRLGLTAVELSNCSYDCAGYSELDKIEICYPDSRSRYCQVYRMNKVRQFITINFTRHFVYNYKCAFIPGNYVVHGKERRKMHCLATPHYCRMVCELQERGNETLVSQKCDVVKGNVWLTFSLYFTVRVIATIFQTICSSLLDATTLALVQDRGGDYGREKVWAVVATAIFSPIAGVFIDAASNVKGQADYSPAFYICDVLLIVTIFATMIMDPYLVMAGKSAVRDLFKLFINLDVLVFLLAVYVTGVLWGVVESFLFWYLLELGSPQYMLGLTITVGYFFSAPFVFYSESIVKRVGRTNLIIISFFVYGVRFFGYSLIENGWTSMPFEAMEVFSVNLMWVAAATHAAQLAPAGLLATFQGIIVGLHYGIGKGSGSFLGGYLIDIKGPRTCFKIVALLAFVSGALYFLFESHRRRKKAEADNTELIANTIKKRTETVHILETAEQGPMEATV